VEEEQVTRRAAAYLKAEGWSVHAIHYPGAHGGIGLRTGPRRRLVPDILASRAGVGVLVVESKSVYTPRDVRKVAQMATGEEFRGERDRLARLVGVEGPWWPAVAFHGPPPRRLAPGVTLLVVSGAEVEAIQAPPGLGGDPD
jgi:hypothetical protein